MSKIGKKPIIIPEGVEVRIENNKIIIKGSKGQLEREFHKQIKIEKQDDKLKLSSLKSGSNISALWGLERSLIANMFEGVTKGFEKKLEIQGIGYKASIQGRKLILSLGFTHPVEIEAPPNIDFKVEKNIITVTGIDKQLVGQITAQIRAQKKPEPYLGKGIRYVGEHIRRKAGKKAVAVIK